MTAATIPVTERRRPPIAPSFADAVAANLDAVHRYLTQMVGDVHLAEDLTAATFERAFTRWHRYDPRKGSPLTWLIAIARNVALDHSRAEGRRRRRESHAAAIEPRHDESVEPAEMSPQLARALDGLTDVEREVVALRVLLDLDGASAARLIGITPSACSTHLHRAMTKLRRDLGP